LRADIIAGFPTETEQMFKDSVNMIKDCNLTHLHIFPYSIRNNTPAALMPQVPKNIIKKRARVLREEGNRQMQKYLQNQIGNSAIMLVEKVKENISYGKSQHFTKIKIEDTIKEGEIVKCKITDINKGILSAHII
jgi:threonylcarbamoyladenosine tRNA methylthiotransferase MtaB